MKIVAWKSSIELSEFPELVRFFSAATKAKAKETYQHARLAPIYEFNTVDVVTGKNTKSSFRAVNLACILGKIPHLQCLIEEGHNEPEWVDLAYAQQHQNWEMIKQLLEYPQLSGYIGQVLEQIIKQHDLDRLLFLLDSKVVLAHSDASNCVALKYAVKTSNLALVELLLTSEGIRKSLSEHSHIAERILISANEKNKMEQSDRIIKILKQSPEILGTSQHRAIVEAEKSKPNPIIIRLLEFHPAINVAERYYYDFYRYLDPIFKCALQSLDQRYETHQQTSANGIFDIKPEEVPLYYYILRHYAKKNNPSNADYDELYYLNVQMEEWTGVILKLLMLPSLAAVLHTNKFSNQPNEILYSVLSNCQLTESNKEEEDWMTPLMRKWLLEYNFKILEVLLEIPDVYLTAEKDNLFKQFKIDPHIQARICNRESSLQALKKCDLEMVQSIERHYHPKMNARGGVDKVFNEFKSYLRESYQNHPAFLTRGDTRQVLPFDWETLKALDLPHPLYQLALQAYYQHAVHTAYRYLSKPNPWLAIDAEYPAEAYPEHPEWRYACFEPYIRMIAYFWLALSDKDMSATENYDLMGRINLFITKIAEMGRTHNWDRHRIKLNSDGQPAKDKFGNIQTEEYDDLEGDKPICFSGSNRGLFEAMQGHPLCTRLTYGLLKKELQELIHDYFKNLFFNKTEEEIKLINQALADVIHHLALPTQILIDLNITEAQKQIWIQYLADKYGTQFHAATSLLTWIKEILALKENETHITRFYLSCMLNLFLGELPLSKEESNKNIALPNQCNSISSEALSGEEKDILLHKYKLQRTYYAGLCLMAMSFPFLFASIMMVQPIGIGLSIGVLLSGATLAGFAFFTRNSSFWEDDRHYELHNTI